MATDFKLLIVESPSKAKTLSNYLKGSGNFMVVATKGHIRDIPSKSGAILPEKNFEMQYEDIEKSAENVKSIKKAAKRASHVMLATDPDREGEAIAWHVTEILKESDLLEGKHISRVVFYQVTKKAVLQAIENPRDLDSNLINAQKTRRALDYLVGFNLSPLLWKKVKPGLSAGRVQSPALVMIHEREQEIREFESKDYFYVNAIANKEEITFLSKLVEFESDKVKQFYFEDKSHVEKTVEKIKNESNGFLEVTEVTRKKRNSNPPPPFTTSTLQQEAAKKYRFSTSKTMRIAQQLYEGLEVAGETKGLITYMRTDSVHVGIEAIADINKLISSKYGKEFCLPKPREFKSKSKNAQEAHEAIRPVNPMLEPEQVKGFLDQDQQKVYSLIWARTIASQMPVAVYSTLAIILKSGNALFKATGSTLISPGYLSLYREEQDETQETKDQKQKSAAESQKLPNIEVGDKVKLEKIDFSEHKTEPPPRFSEASLVKALEEYGIGRPSTYSAIISTITSRNYAELKERKFFPTDTGEVVARFLKSYFHMYVNYNFTADMENNLDLIALGEKDFLPILKDFWCKFENKVQEIEETVQRKDVTSQEIDEDCPECGKKLQLKLGKRGNFVGCSGYPDCSYTRSSIDSEAAPKDEVLDRKCPKCDSNLLEKQGRYGKFIGCSGYPKCKYIESGTKEESGPECPKCSENKLVKRFTKRGKIFYGCSGFPKCKYALWNEPLEEACPSCKWPILTIKISKKNGEEKICPECNTVVEQNGNKDK